MSLLVVAVIWCVSMHGAFVERWLEWDMPGATPEGYSVMVSFAPHAEPGKLYFWYFHTKEGPFKLILLRGSDVIVTVASEYLHQDGSRFFMMSEPLKVVVPIDAPITLPKPKPKPNAI